MDISFTPTQEGEVTFNLRMLIRGKVKPLIMNVKAEGYNMKVCVQYESPEGAMTELTTADGHLVDFKQVSFNISYETAYLSEGVLLYVTLRLRCKRKVLMQSLVHFQKILYISRDSSDLILVKCPYSIVLSVCLILQYIHSFFFFFLWTGGAEW